MAATTKAEKATRPAPGERRGEDGAAALEAIRRVARLLEEEVLPRLPDGEMLPPMGSEPDGLEYDEEKESAVLLDQRGSLPCQKGGPTAADKAVVAKIGPKLRGRLRGHLTPERVCCARRIVAAAKARRLHRRAAVIAVTTTIVESNIINVTYGDRDSLGLFQQRASWGSRAQRLNPTWATNAFLNAMLKKFPKNAWMKTPIGVVCQRVQVSAFPSRYQPEVEDARIIVGALWGAAKAPEVPAVMAEAEDEPVGANQAALEAVERVARMLTEEVIPALSSDHGGDDEPHADGEAFGFGAEDSEPPEVPQDAEDEPPAQDVPAALMDALEDLYGSHSAQQAEALAELFTATAEALAAGDGDGIGVPDDDAVTEDEPSASRPGGREAAPRRTREYA